MEDEEEKDEELEEEEEEEVEEEEGLLNHLFAARTKTISMTCMS